MGRQGKTNERKLARKYYIEQGKSAKETAALVDVSPNTMTNWIKKYNWNAERNAHVLSATAQKQNIEKMIGEIADDRLNLMSQLKEAEQEGDADKGLGIRKMIASLDDGAAKWNKILSNIDKENQISLSVYIHVLENAMQELAQEFPKFYVSKLIDWQMKHIEGVSQKYL